MALTKPVTVTIPEDVLEAARARVEAGDADSLSAYVTGALRRRLEQDERLSETINWVHETFGKPTEEELSHDFLWRIRRGLPAPGYVGVFNRSHYEDVLVVRVHGLVPERTSVWFCPSDRIWQSIGPGVHVPGPLTTVPGWTANRTRCPPWRTPSSTSSC